MAFLRSSQKLYKHPCYSGATFLHQQLRGSTSSAMLHSTVSHLYLIVDLAGVCSTSLPQLPQHTERCIILVACSKIKSLCSLGLVPGLAKSHLFWTVWGPVSVALWVKRADSLVSSFLVSDKHSATGLWAVSQRRHFDLL